MTRIDFSRLETISKKINDASDELTRIISRINDKLNSLNLGIELWLPDPIESDDSTALLLGYGKASNAWGLLVGTVEISEAKEEEVDRDAERMMENLKRPVGELELSVRSYNGLKNADIKTIGELVQKTEDEVLAQLGRKSLNELKEILSEMGLSFGMKPGDMRGSIRSDGPIAASLIRSVRHLLSAPREIRIKAVENIPSLVRALEKECESFTESLVQKARALSDDSKIPAESEPPVVTGQPEQSRKILSFNP